MSPSEKRFKDPVHGYISIQRDWVDDFVDTPIFQRLRNIEQTSMRPVYPAAHHDRFIHSLGTFHLGRRVLSSLREHTEDDEIRRVVADEGLGNTFLIACLMHDCGHAPFSHTFEGFYNYTEAKTAERAYDLLQKEFPGSDFKVDDSFDPAEHEALSAVVLSRLFADQLRTYRCDAELAARMITGCTYLETGSAEKQVRNCLISLLNGKAIDVDKLDYILRDTWASGVHNAAIDVDRLLNSVALHRDANGNCALCFHKSALSVLQHVVDARNYLYEWVYNHHTVLYYAELLNRSLRKLASHLSSTADRDAFWKEVFSLAPFSRPVKLAKGASVYLPTDGDMVHLLKHFSAAISLPEFEEWLSHKPQRMALWKTCAEFRLLFKGSPVAGASVCKSVSKRLPGMVCQRLGCQEDDVIVVSALAKHYVIEPPHLHVLVDGEVKAFTDLVGEERAREGACFFYVFVSPELAGEREAIIEMLRQQSR